MSAIGHCARQLAYNKHEVAGLPIDWRSKIIFDDGDMHHDQIRKALREGLVLTKACYGLYGEEEEVDLGILKGHIDGALIHETTHCDNPSHKDMLLEVKSMNDRGFQEFKRTRHLSFEYQAQVSAYLRASAMESAFILVKNKNTGEMDSIIYEGDDDLLDNRLTILADVLKSETPEDIRREYHARADGSLDWQCNYCPFVMMCWRHEGVVQESRYKYKLIAQKLEGFRETSTKTVKEDKNKGNALEETNGTEVAKEEGSAQPKGKNKRKA